MAILKQLGALQGAATRFKTFETSGALTGQLGSIAGIAEKTRVHEVTGNLIASGTTLSATTNRFRAFETTGDLIATTSIISGVAIGTLHDIISNSGGGVIKPRQPILLTKPRPAWMPPILWALPVDELQNPLTDSTTVGDVELMIRKRLMRRQKDEQELLLLGLFNC